MPATQRELGGISVAYLPAIAVLSKWNMFSPRLAALAVTGSLTVLLILRERHRLAPSLRRIAVELVTITTVILFVSQMHMEMLRRGVAIGTLIASRYSGVPLEIVSARANAVFALLSLTLYALALGTLSSLSPGP